MASDSSRSDGANLVSICEVDDIFHRHLLSFLSCRDASRLEETCRTLNRLVDWTVLCDRDFRAGLAPVYGQDRHGFDALETNVDDRENYRKWRIWRRWTHGAATAQHMVRAVELWSRLRGLLGELGLDNILRSFSPCLDSDGFSVLAGKIPSSLAALYSIHGGQELLRANSQDQEFFAGLLGSYSCYNNYYSMRLLMISEFLEQAKRDSQILIALSPGNPRVYLYLCPTEQDPEGHLQMACNNPISHQSIQLQLPVVGHGGILTYIQNYVEHLEAGIYKPCHIMEESMLAQGIGLFPDAGPLMSECVTRGVQVRASARWFPEGVNDRYGLNFGYSIRLQLVEDVGTCQLVGRHWEFMDGNGNVRRVDGDAVVGKQPLFFRLNGRSGYQDLGPAGDGSRYEDKVFVYQSQSGPVEGTTLQDTQRASVKGTFSFRPGSISNPTGPLFHVTVANFPLHIPTPFY